MTAALVFGPNTPSGESLGVTFDKRFNFSCRHLTCGPVLPAFKVKEIVQTEETCPVPSCKLWFGVQGSPVLGLKK